MMHVPRWAVRMGGLVSLVAVSAASQQPLRSPPGEFVGTTGPTLIRGGLESVAPLLTVKASDTVIGALPSGAYHPGDSVFRAYIPWGKPLPLHVIIVEPRSGGATLYADLNQDRQFDHTERFSLQAGGLTLDPDQWPGFSETVTLNVALPPGSYFKHLPFSLYYRPARVRGKSPLRLLASTYIARGHVTIDGERLAIAYDVDSETGGLQRAGYRAIGDDVAMAVEGEPEPVFRVGNRFVAIASVDPTTGNVLLRERRSASSEPEDDDGATAKKYRARLGRPLPDFTFIDRQGKSRSLADFRGKFLLIDIWALDCGPCAADLPYLREAYRRFHSKGFEILGFELRGPRSAVTGWSEERAVRWAQIDGTTLHDMLAGTWGVVTTPTYILLAPDGNVLTMGTIGPYNLRGVNLWRTLGQLLPDAGRSPGQSSETVGRLPQPGR